MKKIIDIRTVAIVCFIVLSYLTPYSFSSAQQQKPSDTTLKDESEARALYEKMIETIRKARTLSYESAFRSVSGGHELDHGKYKVWMKKPNYFYVEVKLGDDNKRGVVIGDGQYAWSYWPDGRPWFSGEDHNAYEKTRFNVYMKEPAPLGKYSIGYATVMKKGNCFPVINPSVFQGVKDTIEPFIDWVRNVSVEKVGNEDCKVIEISHMNNQRSYYFWISGQDNLPRKLKDIVRTDEDIVTHEVWSKVAVNVDIPMDKFRWAPPEDWKQWYPPVPEDKLLKPGQQAPDFELLSINGGKIKLSDYRGKVVWLNFWRVGCPPCREEIPYLEGLHRKYRSKGLIVLGFNFSDDRQMTLDFLHENSITFPNILDTSDKGIKTGFMTYGATAAPVNYIIDREGKVAYAWIGYDQNSKRGIEKLENLELR